MKLLLSRSLAVLLVALLSITSLAIFDVKANFLTKPEITLPPVKVISPVIEQAYPSNNVWLNITVDTPRDWISNITYYLDDYAGFNKSETIRTNDPLNVATPASNFTFSFQLTEMPEGHYTIDIEIWGEVNSTTVGTLAVNNYFNVNNQSPTPFVDPTPFRFSSPNLIIATTISLLIGLGILAYFKKYRK